MTGISARCPECRGPLVPVSHEAAGGRSIVCFDIVRCKRCGWAWWANAAEGSAHRCLMECVPLQAQEAVL